MTRRRHRPEEDRRSDVEEVERQLARGSLEMTPFVVILLLAGAIAAIVLVISGVLLAVQAFL